MAADSKDDTPKCIGKNKCFGGTVLKYETLS